MANDFNIRVKITSRESANQIAQEINQLLTKVEGQVKAVKIDLKVGNYDAFRRQIGTLRGELNALNNELNSSDSRLRNRNSRNRTRVGGNISEITQFETQQQRIEDLTTKVRKYIDTLQNASTEYIHFSKKHAAQNNEPFAFDQYLTRLEQVRTRLDQLDNTSPDLNDHLQQIKNIISDYENWADRVKNAYNEQVKLDKNTDKYNAVLRDLTRDLNNYGSEIQKNTDLYSRYKKLEDDIFNRRISTTAAKRELAEIREEAHRLGIDVDSAWGKLKKLFREKWAPMLATQGWYWIADAMRQVYDNVVQLDTAMTELRKVTEATEAEYIQFLDNAEERARKLGATLVEVVSTSADWSRLGYSMSESEILADATLIYNNVADGINNIEDASSVLISTLQGMGYAVEDVTKIIDIFNEVSNNFGSSAGDIGEIVKRSVASMKVAGSSLEEIVALGVVSNEVIQDAASTGTAMKTMAMRLRSSKSDLESAGEDTDGMAESVSKLREEILALSGVDIMIDDSTYKTPYAMLMELGQVWNDLTDISRANIGELLFGKRQANIGFAILENAERAQAILETAQNSAGKVYCPIVQKCA